MIRQKYAIKSNVLLRRRTDENSKGSPNKWVYGQRKWITEEAFPLIATFRSRVFPEEEVAFIEYFPLGALMNTHGP